MFWEAFGEPWTLGNHAKAYNCMQFQGLDRLDAESVSGSAFGRGLAGIPYDLGADWGTHWGSILLVLPAFSGSDFGGGFRKAKRSKKFVKWFGRRQGRGLLSLL